MGKGLHPIGTGTSKARTSYESGPTKGTGSQPTAIKAHVGSEKRGSSFLSKSSVGHENQPDGHSIGTGQAKAQIRGMPHGGDAHIFRGHSPSGADCFQQAGHKKDGLLRNSGVAGAHRIGKSK